MSVWVELNVLNSVLLISDLFDDSLNLVLRFIRIDIGDLLTGRWHDDNGLVL